MTAPRPSLALELPTTLVNELSEQLARYATLRTEAQLVNVRASLASMCTAAHRQGVGPEKLVVAIKQAWEQATATQRAPENEFKSLFECVLTVCLEAYYGAEPGPRADR